MKVITFGKKVAVGLGTAALAAGLLSASAQADPPPAGQVAGGGSDTTQDVVQRIAEESGGLFESWNASPDVHANINPKGAEDELGNPIIVTKPNGSSEGVAALRRAQGANVATPWATNPVPVGSDVFDFARSSSGPSASQLDPAGALVYIPAAIDTVQYASHFTSTAPENLTLTNLQQLYSTGSTVVGGDTITATTWNGSAAVVGDITLYVPQDGSGTRSFWLSTVGISGALPTWVFDRYNELTGLPTKLTTGTQAQEHDGTVLEQDATGVAVVPYSAAQWTAQENFDETGVDDRRHGALLYGPDITRTVYNVVVHADTASGPIADSFVGANSQFCDAQGDAAVTLFGFDVHPSCGVVSDSNRVRLVP